MHRRMLVALTLLLIATAASLAPGDSFAEDPPSNAPRDPGFGSGFAFQGRLTVDGIPANGTFDFQFYLYDADTSGMQINAPESRSLSVTNGIFNTALSFGLDSPLESGNDYWVEVRVKKPADASYTLLTPRQRLSPAPYAITAAGIPAGTQVELGSDNAFGLAAIYTSGPEVIAGFMGVNTSVTRAGIVGFGQLTTPGMRSYGGSFVGNTAGVLSDSETGYGIRTETRAPARAALLAEHDGTTCTGGNITADDPLQQYCYAIAGIADGESTSGIGVYAYGTNTAIWGVTDNPAGYSGFFSGGKVRMSDGTVFGVTSDGRLKKDISTLTVGLDELLQLKPSTYAWKRDTTSTPHYGFIAQDVRDVLPAIVDEDEDGTLSIEPLDLLPVIVKSIQEQQTQIDALQPASPATSVVIRDQLPASHLLALLAATIAITAILAGAAGALVSQRLQGRFAAR